MRIPSLHEADEPQLARPRGEDEPCLAQLGEAERRCPSSAQGRVPFAAAAQGRVQLVAAQGLLSYVAAQGRVAVLPSPAVQGRVVLVLAHGHGFGGGRSTSR